VQTLEHYGWNSRWEAAFNNTFGGDAEPARATSTNRGHYTLWARGGVREAVLRLSGGQSDELATPVVGDWVAWHPGDDLVLAVLPRRSLLVRRAASKEVRPQAICANADVVLVVTAAGGDLNQRRVERYLAAIRQSGATPVVVMNKAERSIDLAADLQRLRAVSAGAIVLAVSAAKPGGLAGLDAVLQPRTTVVLVGSSGVGKSTMSNALLGREQQATATVRAGDDHGRHTTTGPSLWQTPSGVLLVDTAGMREFGLWEAEDGLDQTFPDIARILGGCRFRDCGHTQEPGCAVQAALADGALSSDRWLSYQKLQSELAQTAQHREQRPLWEQRQEVRRFAKLIRDVKQRERRRGG
jgi:ribosome biogenesis GTPase